MNHSEWIRTNLPCSILWIIYSSHFPLAKRLFQPAFQVGRQIPSSALRKTRDGKKINHNQPLKSKGACVLTAHTPFCQQPLSGNCHIICFVKPVLWTATRGRPVVRSVVPECVFSRLSLFYNFLPLSLFLNGNIISYGRANGNIFSLGMRKPPFEAEQGTIIKNHEETFSFSVYFSPSFLYGITLL